MTPPFLNTPTPHALYPQHTVIHEDLPNTPSLSPQASWGPRCISVLEAVALERRGGRREYLSLTQTLPLLTPALEKNRSYVISSFTELKAYDLLSKAAVQFVEYP